MSDDLRDRIAAVLKQEIPHVGIAAEAVADVVIAELGLHREVVSYTLDETTGRYVVNFRYVTDQWKGADADLAITANWTADE